MLRKLAFTGHRPSKLAGYKPEDNKELLWKLQKEIIRFIEEEKVSVFISGVALGIDTWAALIVIKLKETYPHIKLWSAIPCTGHPNKWKESDRIIWFSGCGKSSNYVQSMDARIFKKNLI